MKRLRFIVLKLHQPAVGGRGFPASTYRTEDGEATFSWRRSLISNPMGGPVADSWKSPLNQLEYGEFVDNEKNRRRFTVKGRPSQYTQVFALVGPGTAFTEYAYGTGRDSKDAEPDAILLIDCKNELVHWMEPIDIELSGIQRHACSLEDSLAPNYPPGFLIAFVDGAVWWIRKDVPQEVLEPFLTLDGARFHNRDDELAKYALDKYPPLVIREIGFYFLPEEEEAELRRSQEK